MVAAADTASLVGVLALQGGYAAHIRMLASLGARTREVRTAAELEDLDGLVIPGGESTTMTLGVEREGLGEPLRAFAANTPILGTCAGLIMLDRDHLGVCDYVARRNAFGRQIRSFETDLDLFAGDEPPIHAVFIRAPWIAEHGASVEILAEVDGHPVAARDGDHVVVSFHPELSGDTRLHAAFLKRIAA